MLPMMLTFITSMTTTTGITKNETDSHPMKDGEKHEHHKHNGTTQEQKPDSSKLPVQPADDTTVFPRGDFKGVIDFDHLNETELPVHHKFNKTGKAHPHYNHGVKLEFGDQPSKPLSVDGYEQWEQHQRNSVAEGKILTA